MTTVAYLFAVLIAGVAGYGLLVRVGLDDGEAWAAGRAAGLVAMALPAWWVGVAGLSWWWMVGVAVGVAAAAWGVRELTRRRPWRDVGRAELLFWLVTAAVLFIRLDRSAVLHQEKLMDQGILASLLRATSFPPPDMWLAGDTLPYYYWGALVWALPMRAADVPIEYGYNWTVALVGGLIAVLAWAVGRRLGGSGVAGGVAMGAVLAGTPDAWRQLLGGRALSNLDYWASSRQVHDAITEFPLFTVWHGDLHPHLLSMPLALLAWLLAAHAGRRGPRLADMAAVAVACGVTWAANPWAMPPTLAGAALLLLCGDGRWHWPVGPGLRRWIAVGVVSVGSWLVTAPFHLDFSPPFQGLGRVFAWTPPLALMLWGGVLLVPAFLAVVSILGGWVGGSDDVRRRAVQLGAAAVTMVVAAASGRPTLVLVAAAGVVLTTEVLRPGESADRPALAMAALGLFLLAVPEVVYVVDSYGDRLHRMNTIFKAWIQGWTALAVALPVLARRAAPDRARRRALLAVVAVLAVAHPVGMAWRVVRAPERGVDGLVWLTPGDRALVDELRRQPLGATVIEAVGPAYSEFARLSSASGVPALLGWENHELVWRGPSITPETARRREVVETVYSSDDPDEIRRLARAEGVDFIAVGSLENRTVSEGTVAAIREAGEVVLDREGGLLVRVLPGTAVRGAEAP